MFPHTSINGIYKLVERGKIMVITIDGLGVNGKSTLAEKISKKLGFKNFNTGAIYRCIALYVIENGIDIDDISFVLNNIKNINIDFIDRNIFLNGTNVTDKIQTEKISYYSTKWATIHDIKLFVRNYQKEFIKNNNTVMEGRDIATRIAPDADVKFYLYSDFDIRVERLWNKNKNIDKEEIRKNLQLRDELDLNGGNFVKPQDAIEIDVSNYTIEEVYELMMNNINKTIKKN